MEYSHRVVSILKALSWFADFRQCNSEVAWLIVLMLNRFPLDKFSPKSLQILLEVLARVAETAYYIEDENYQSNNLFEIYNGIDKIFSFMLNQIQEKFDLKIYPIISNII